MSRLPSCSFSHQTLRFEPVSPVAQRKPNSKVAQEQRQGYLKACLADGVFVDSKWSLGALTT